MPGVDPVTPANAPSAPSDAVDRGRGDGNSKTQQIFDQAIQQIMTSVVSNSLNQMQSNMQDAQSDNS